LKFGVLRAGVSAPEGTEHAGVLHEMTAGAELAEQLGFYSFWVTEHHFASDRGYRPFELPDERYTTIDYDLSADPLQLLTYVAARTSTIRLGTGVVLLHVTHPVRMAEKAMLLDALSNGRLELGVGRGATPYESGVWDVPAEQDANQRRFDEALAIIRGLWSGEPFEFDGEYYKVPWVAGVLPKPLQQPAPIWIGSASLGSSGLAAKQHLPYATITWPLTSLDMYRQKLALFREEADKAGYDITGVDLPHVLFLHCAETDEQAAEEAFEYLLQFQYLLEQHYEIIKRYGNQQVTFGSDAGGFGDLEGLARFPIEHHVIGSPETCIERIDWFRRELDCTYLLLNVGYGAMPYELMERSMRLFSERVMPHYAAQSVAV
jgi:alkanesulfonate monooxygenase SsuD/methylene tetrahydromethanopterin reductase-like flavin-dependent oxidoreductase (luciferase family)